MKNPQAEALNEKLKGINPGILEMLSEKGKAIFFPKKGILSQAADAKGKEINATIGIALEDDNTPLVLGNLASKISLDKKNAFPYAPSYGRPDLRKAWKEMIQEKNPSLAGVPVSNPVVTNALTHGLSMCGYLFGNPGDKLILPGLFWGNYKLIFSNAYGIELDTFDTFTAGGGFNVKGLEEKLAGEPGKKLVLLNFPNNPAGYTPTVEEVKEIKRVLLAAAEKNKVVVIIDDAYFGLVYEEGIYKESIFTELAGLHSNILAVKVDGPTKEDYVWGFRTGFITYGIKDGESLYGILEDKTAGAIRGNISNAPNLSQSLLLSAYQDEKYPEEKKMKFEVLKNRYEKVKSILAGHAEYSEVFEPLPFNSGYFMCIKLKSADPEQVRQVLLEKYSTGIIAMAGIVRVAFSSTPLDKLEKLFNNIYAATKEVGAGAK